MERGGHRTAPALRLSYPFGRRHMRVTSPNHFDLRRCVPMSQEEFHRCALEYVKTKDPVVGERLIVANMRLVVAQAHHHCRSEGDLADIVQEGNRGLVRALQTYDPTRGLKFCTYAVWWIRSYMLQFTIDNWRLVKVGTTQAQRDIVFLTAQGARKAGEDGSRGRHQNAGVSAARQGKRRSSPCWSASPAATCRWRRQSDHRIRTRAPSATP